MRINIPNVFRPPGEAHFSPFPQTYEIRSKAYHIQKVHQIQKVYLIGIIFTNMLPCKHIFQNISSLTPGLTPRWIGRSWQISFFAVNVQEKKDSVHSSAALTAVSGQMRCTTGERDVKDKVHTVQSCSAEVQSNPEAEEMGLPSRAVADVPEPRWRIPYVCRQVHAASWLWAVTGKVRCLLCNEGVRRQERPPLPGEWSDGNIPKANSVAFWDCGLLTVSVVLSGMQMANTYVLGYATRLRRR